MKKVLFLVLSFVLFSLSFSFVSPFSASADSSFDISLDSVLNYAKSCYLSYTDSLCKKITAARAFYFYYIITDYTCSGLPVFDDSGFKFSDEILDFYYAQYNGTKKSYITGSLGWGASNDIYNSDGDIFLQEAGFPGTRWSLSLCNFGVGLDDAHTSYPGVLDKPYFKQYYNTMLARYLIANGYDVTDPFPGKSGLDIAPGYVTSDELVEGIEFDNSQYTAKDYNQITSFLTDKYFHQQIDNYSSYSSGFCRYAPVLEFSGCFFGGGANDVYFVPFYKGKEYNYLGMYQFHLTFETVILDDGSAILVPRLWAWDIFDGDTELNAVNLFDDTTSDFSSFKYIRCEMWNDTYFTFSFYSTLSDFLSNKNSSSVFFGSASKYLKLYRADLLGNTTYYNQMFSSLHYYQGSIDYFNQNHPDYIGTDIGFYVSDKPITTTYQFIDASKIPANQIITINGDTIYNYTITNPDTGESNTINEYVTNNYTYITNNNGGEAGSSSGSGVGGSVTVGGSIDVGGSVGVDITVSVPDININVNGGSGAGGSGTSIANPDDFTSADNVDLTKYYDNAVEQSSGFQKFLKDFFGFLPAELLGLILFAVAMAIMCRVFGR